MGTQRAEIVGDALRQHRHHPVREVDRIAARERLAIERGTRLHVVGDIRDGDADHVAAGIFRIGIRRRMHGVIVILGVRRIDGDEGDRAPVFSLAQARGPGSLCFAQRG
jgi:hypothetical protein